MYYFSEVVKKMRYYILLITTIFIFSCGKEKVLLLPEIDHSEISEIKDVSHAYLFYDDTKIDNTELNRKNLISTTNWLINIDKRLTLKQAIPHIKYLQEKKANSSHKNENAKNYFTCNDISRKNLGFIEFTDVVYKNESLGNYSGIFSGFEDSNNSTAIAFQKNDEIIIASTILKNHITETTIDNLNHYLKKCDTLNGIILLNFNEELNLISKKLFEEYERTENVEYLETKDYINLIRSAGFRPGLEPLRIKRFQYRFINDKKNKEQILAFTLFKTKTKPKHQLTCNPYFTKNIFPEIEKRHADKTAEDYLLFPNTKDRQKVYNRIVKIFTRISKELNLYYRNGSTRPIYSIRHTFIKNRYAENPANLEVIARQSNTSSKMIHKNYLDEDDVMLIEEHRKFYPKKKTS